MNNKVHLQPLMKRLLCFLSSLALVSCNSGNSKRSPHEHEIATWCPQNSKPAPADALPTRSWQTIPTPASLLTCIKAEPKLRGGKPYYFCLTNGTYWHGYVVFEKPNHRRKTVYYFFDANGRLVDGRNIPDNLSRSWSPYDEPGSISKWRGVPTPASLIERMQADPRSKGKVPSPFCETNGRYWRTTMDFEKSKNNDGIILFYFAANGDLTDVQGPGLEQSLESAP